MQKYLIALGILLFFSIAAWTANSALTSMFDYSAEPLIECNDAHGARISMDSKDTQTFQRCVDTNAKRFLQGDYAELKDLAKTFLTLLSAILVASITFSEKIVDVSKARVTSIAAMITCWSLLLFAIVSCGVGLAIMTEAAGVATYSPELDYGQLETRGINLLLKAGVAFGFSLVAMIIGGATALMQKWKIQQG